MPISSNKSQFTVGTGAVPLDASSNQPVLLKNISGGTLYYDDTRAVSAGTNDGSLAAGASVYLESPAFLASASTTIVSVTLGSAAQLSPAISVRTYQYITALTNGTDTTPVAGTVYYATLPILASTRVTGAAVLNGTAVAGNITYALYDAGGNVIGSTASTAQSGTAVFQSIAFSSKITLDPGIYAISLSCSSTSARFRSIAAATNLPQYTGSATGTYGTLAAITFPSSFTADVGPYMHLY